MAGRLAAEWVGRRAEGGAPGWHARKGGAAARTMALTTAAAAGVPMAAGALLARPPPAQAGAGGASLAQGGLAGHASAVQLRVCAPPAGAGRWGRVPAFTGRADSACM
jgi:hypothetical protein